jgi:hypothetical protein
MQQINIPSSSSANYTEYAELKHALVRCFNCSSEIADAYARRLAQCSVPEGHDREEWLLYLAWEIGITELGVAGLTESIPSVVTTEPTMFRLSQLQRYESAYGDRRVVAFKVSTRRANEELVSRLARVPDIGDKRLLFLGLAGRSVRELALQNRYSGSYGRQHISPNSNNEDSEFNFNEFGTGVYCTPDIRYAVHCAGNGGAAAVMVYDWSDVRELSVLYKTDLDEWRTFVKQNIRLNQPDVMRALGPPPNELDENYDCIQGKITKNYKATKMGNFPEQSEFTQVVVIRDFRRILGSRFIGIIYLTSDDNA